MSTDPRERWPEISHVREVIRIAFPCPSYELLVLSSAYCGVARGRVVTRALQVKGTSIITRGLVVRGRYAPYIQQLPEAFYTLDSFNNKEAKELQYTPRLTEAKNSLTTKRVDALYAKIKSLSPQTAKAVSKEQLQQQIAAGRRLPLELRLMLHLFAAERAHESGPLVLPLHRTAVELPARGLCVVQGYAQIHFSILSGGFFESPRRERRRPTCKTMGLYPGAHPLSLARRRSCGT